MYVDLFPFVFLGGIKEVLKDHQESKIPRSQHVHRSEIYISLFCVVDFAWAKRSLSQFQTVKSHLRWAGKQYKQQQCMLCLFIYSDTDGLSLKLICHVRSKCGV